MTLRASFVVAISIACAGCNGKKEIDLNDPAVAMGLDLDDPAIVKRVVQKAINEMDIQYRGPDGARLSMTERLRDGPRVAYAPGSDVPYTGWTKVGPDDSPLILSYLKDGEGGGRFIMWDYSGLKEFEEFYKDGKRVKLRFMNGELETESLYHNDGSWEETVFRNGERARLRLYKKGKILKETYYKDGKPLSSPGDSSSPG